MIRLKIPSYDWQLVRRLSQRPDQQKAKLWERTGGHIGRFKQSVTEFLKMEQARKCAYCMSYMNENLPARDHIAPKSTYPKWTFRPDNLVLVCYSCNTDHKKNYDPIGRKHRKYKRCEFKIVHPYFDVPDIHLDYEGGDRKGILIKAISAKGKETIRLFELMTPARAKQRAGAARYEELPNRLEQRFQTMLESALEARVPLKPAARIISTGL